MLHSYRNRYAWPDAMACYVNPGSLKSTCSHTEKPAEEALVWSGVLTWLRLCLSVCQVSAVESSTPQATAASPSASDGLWTENKSRNNLHNIKILLCILTDIFAAVNVAIIRKALSMRNTRKFIRVNLAAKFPGVTSGRLLFRSMGAMKVCKWLFGELNRLGNKA